VIPYLPPHHHAAQAAEPLAPCEKAFLAALLFFLVVVPLVVLAVDEIRAARRERDLKERLDRILSKNTNHKEP
jgi:hypothetical protein